jgi:transcriptional regulator with XRE-family HTH domain
MEQHKHKNQNRLVLYRRRMGFSQKQVVRLLGLKGTSMLSRYEHGQSLPPLPTAFRLGIVLRVPLEFLFPGLYESLRIHVRADEERFALPLQRTLLSR